MSNTVEQEKLYRDNAWDKKACDMALHLVGVLQNEVPEAKVYFIGALSLGLNGHNDVDLNVHVHTDDPEMLAEREVVISRILGHEPTAQERHLLQWEYVADAVVIDCIAYDNSFEGVNEQIRIHELLRSSEELREEYAELKRVHDGTPLAEYQDAKKCFFQKVLQNGSSV